jgi:hypothetical protein
MLIVQVAGLLSFLKLSHVYEPNAALRLCSSHKPEPLHREMVFLLRRQGNFRCAILWSAQSRGPAHAHPALHVGAYAVRALAVMLCVHANLFLGISLVVCNGYSHSPLERRSFSVELSWYIWECCI